MMVHSSNQFMCWWSVTNRIVNDLDGTGHRNRKNCVRGNGCCFFGCLVSKIVTSNERMAGDPLNKDGRQDGIDGTVN